jgi:crossover junction endodeoxyribonuclease RuvC
MRVIGIDPGTRHLGWGVLDQQGTRIDHVAHGVIDVDERLTLAERLVIIDKALEVVLTTHRPEVSVVEAIFFAKDASAAAKLGHARGVVLLRLAYASLPIHEIPPARVKRAVAGNGRATKEQVCRFVTAMLRLPAPPRLDASDALANAFAHLAMAKFDEAIKASTAAREQAIARAKERLVRR